MNRKKKFIYSSGASIIKQIVGLICGMILPRLILVHYGTQVNGLVSSIGQFLSLIGIFDAGMGVVIEASLFAPLAVRDNARISAVLASGKKFYNRIVQILLIYVLILSVSYPKFVSGKFDYFYVLLLVLAISVSYFGQYYFGVVNSVLLTADQRGYIYYNVYTFTTILNTIVCIIMMKMNAPIHLMKLGSSIVFFLRPLILAIYVKKNYNINWKQEYNEEPIKQKWNGFAQHIATLVVGNTDVVVLTLFSTLENVSIYSVYYLVVNGLKEMLNSSMAGIKSIFGDMYVRNEKKKLVDTFSLVEAIIHFCTTYIFGIAAILIVPFVSVYTRGVYDANYNVPIFGFIICLAFCVYCLRMPYNSLLMSIGHFKETQTSSIIEAIINIVISIITVSKLGLIGVAIGTFAAVLYRFVYLAYYTNKVILKRTNFYTTKLIIIDILLITCVLYILQNIGLNEYNYYAWIKIGLRATILTFPFLLIAILVGNPNIFRLGKQYFTTRSKNK
nr:polysaccharide biosynthesis C-terminal domain-containing protein [uncultured Eisenbergiella sp.]